MATNVVSLAVPVVLRNADSEAFAASERYHTAVVVRETRSFTGQIEPVELADGPYPQPDLGLARDVEESFRIFQGRILDEYEAMAQEMGFHIIDATMSIEDQQRRMRKIVVDGLGSSLKNGSLKNGVLHLPSGGDFGTQPSTTPVL